MPLGNNQQRQRPIIIGNIQNAEERAMLERQLATQGMTLADVDVLTIPQCRERGLADNTQFLAMIRKMGFNSLEEMEILADRMQRNGMIGNVVEGNNENENNENA